MINKGEKERYKHLNAEFQRIARRDKKAFLSNHCKEIEENNGMGKTRDLFKKIRDSKGTFHAKMGSIKDRNGMDLLFEPRRSCCLLCPSIYPSIHPSSIDLYVLVFICSFSDCFRVPVLFDALCTRIKRMDKIPPSHC